MLAHKYVAPGVPANVLDRARLTDLFRKLFDDHRVVHVRAAAGTGKTVQAQVFAADCAWPTAWLTLDASDSSTSRFLTDLAISIEEFCAGSTDALHWALRTGSATAEAAATLAETVGSQDVLVVIDEAEHLLLDEALVPALTTFLEYAPHNLRCMILSRESLGGAVRRNVLENVYGFVSEDDLRLTLVEVAEFLEMRGVSDHDPQAVLETTGGWMAGMAFGSRFDASQASHSEEFTDYLRDEILGQLAEPEREFLVKTALADVVTPGLAEAMLGEIGRVAYVTVADRHLPAMTSSTGRMVFHSVLRGFLRSELDARSSAEKTELFRRGAAHFESMRDREQATEWYLSAGDLDDAARTAEAELPDLYERSDWITVARWLDRFGEEYVTTRPLLVAARVRSMFGLRQFDEVVAVIRRYDQRGRLRDATDADRGLLATVGWALQADASEAKRYLARYEGDYRVDSVRYMLDALTGLEPAVPPIDAGGDDVERLVSWGLLWQGRLAELLRMAPTTEDLPVLNPNTILAYIWRGDVESGRELWSRVPQAIRERAHSKFIEGCILHAEGELDDALAAVRAALGDSRRIGFRLDPVYEVFAAHLLLSLGATADAIAVLERKIGELSENGDLAILEMAQTWLGLALLRSDRNDEARFVLQECVRSMSAAQRRLFFPASAVFLSEALSRVGDDEAAHEMAAQAHHTASLMGSFFWLVEALRAVPEVLDREVRSDPLDSRWRRLLFAPSAHVERGHTVPDRPSVVVEVQPFGSERDLIVNGDPAGVGRLKVIELAACLALHPAGIDRFELQRRLFPDVDQRRGGNHFRQIAHKLREVVGVNLGRSGQLVTWPEHAVIDSRDARFERLVVAAMSATGRDRLQLLRDSLAGVAGGYLESSDLAWVEERRYHLDVVREEALTELAELAFELDDLAEVRDACERILQLNPYSDKAYTLLMRIESSAGTAVSCQAVYRRAVEALSELGVEPSDEMRTLARATS